jgi:SAM-dependent methyltransferase
MKREDWNRRWRTRDLHCLDDPGDEVAGEIDRLEPGRALDLACGAGRHAIWLAERGWQVTGVDFSEVALDQARELAHERGVQVDWVLADLLDYEPEVGAFDLVLVLFLHLPADERRAVLARSAAALARGGTLLLVGHDRANLGTGAPGPSDPAVLYRPAEVAAELPGLEVERAESLVRLVGTGAGEARAIDALVRASRRRPDSWRGPPLDRTSRRGQAIPNSSPRTISA